MLDLIKEIELCIKSNHLRCALGMALTLPDMCGIIEFPHIDKVGERYELWCEKYLFNQGLLPTHKVDYSKPPEEWEQIRVIEPNMCYKLRCAFLHSGNLELNQRDKDKFPVFRLHISSSEENGVYTDSKWNDKKLNINQISLDIRKLTRVLCNAAKEYYDQHEPKEDFENHNAQVVNVEREASEFLEEKYNFNKLQASKNDLGSYEELSELAKAVLQRVANGEQKQIKKELMTDKKLLFAVNELVEAGILIIPGNTDKYK